MSAGISVSAFRAEFIAGGVKNACIFYHFNIYYTQYSNYIE